MNDRPLGAPAVTPPNFEDLKICLSLGVRDFLATPWIGLFFASFYVVVGLAMTWITYVTGQTFWLILSVLGFPLIGAFAALGLYETSRRRANDEPLTFPDILGVVLSHRHGQLPWLAVIIVVVFLFWFFLGHMIFALFLGLSPMTNVSTSLDVFLTNDGLVMIAVGTVVGAVFATLVFSMSVLGIPMLLDRDVDFVTAAICSMSAVKNQPMIYLLWGVFVGALTLIAMVPFFLGLFVVMPVLGHTTWHLYKRVSQPAHE
ncbi:MAG: DUF2189 domain-containing protein [Albidovulum sp.]